MAMLAEKKTKTKYFLHHKGSDPRGNAWCQDSNKIGQKLLEKMGWSPGKGLGVNENGDKDPVKVSYKWDSKGMGFKGTDGDEAVAQQQDFEALLATINNQNNAAPSCNNGDDSPRSLVLKSQASRARVHYHKFTRGKDLSRASNKDLACILGTGIKMAQIKQEPIIPAVGPVIGSSKDCTFGVTTIASGNMKDYFKMKHLERKMKQEVKEEKAEEAFNIHGNSFDTGSIVKEEDVSSPAETGKKKKKKKSKKDDDNEALNTTPKEEDVSVNKSRRRSVTWGDVEVSFVSKYIKDMVDTSSEDVYDSIDNWENQDEISNEKISKKKKKKKSSVESTEGENALEENENVVFNEKSKKEKKKKKSYVSDKSVAESENFPVEKENSEENESKKKKKDKSEVPNCENVSADCEKNVDEAEPRKKKKKDKSEVPVYENISADSKENVDEADQRKKKKTKPDSLAGVTDCGEAIAEETKPLKSKKKRERDEVVEPLSGKENSLDGTNTVTAKSKKRKRKDLESESSYIEERNSIDVVMEETSLKKKKKKKSKSNITDSLSENFPEEPHKMKKRKKDAGMVEDGVESNVSNGVTESMLGNFFEEPHKMKRRKKEKLEERDARDQSELDQKPREDVKIQHVSDKSHAETVGKPALSSLTQERMAKWKARSKSLEKKRALPTESTEASERKSETATLHLDNSLPTEDYNARRFLAAVGLNVKKGVNKEFIVKVPPSHFVGSNLDSIPGYGRVGVPC